MTRHTIRTTVAAAAAALLALAGCSGDDPDQPPSAVIVYPESGHHAAAAPDSVVVDAQDDRGINRVEIRLDGQLLSTVRREPYITRLPLGIYADGRPHALTARAWDTRGQTADAAAVTITIDPALQTVPQVTSLLPAPGDPQSLRLAWLPWPRAPWVFSWQVALDDAFVRIVAAGSHVDTTVTVAVDPDGIVYARVRADDAGGASGWSRTARHSGVQTWRRVLPLPGPQLGAALHAPVAGGLRILSHGAAGHPVGRAPVQVLLVDAQGELEQVQDLLPDSYLPTDASFAADGSLLLAGRRDGGGSFLAGADPAGGVWTAEPDLMHPTALLRFGPGAVLVAGAARGADQPGGVLATVDGQGDLTLAGVFPLAADREARRLWVRPGGGYVLAGQVTDPAGGAPAGIWLLGLSGDLEVQWTVRLGSADRWLFCGAAADDEGIFAVAGIALRGDVRARYGFLAAVDAQGRVRWQTTDRDWQQFGAVAAASGGRWVAAGARRRDIGDQRFEYDLALRGLSSAGATLWEAVHRAGPDSRAWSLAPHPLAGWYAAGARRDGGGNYDVDLLRVDDRGELQ